MTKPDVVVVGGGLGGLTAACFLARAGRRVLLLEKKDELGGRARTDESEGFSLNLGPHALYAHGRGPAVLAELGVGFTGKKAQGRGALALADGELYLLPTSASALLLTRLLSVGDKAALARLLGGLPKMDPARLAGTSVADWVEGMSDRARVRALLLALVRLSTYSHPPERLDAGATLRQLQIGASGGVYYLDGGWGTLVRGLGRAAKDAGVVVATGQAVDDLGDFAGLPTVLAVAPETASRLLGQAIAPERVAAQVACLDVLLRRAPRRARWLALGIDAPVYAAVHSRFARLAPAGGALIHAAKYLAGDDHAKQGSDADRGPPGSDADRAQLEGVLDKLVPGWRDEVVHQRFLPRMTVTHAIPAVATPRSPVQVAGRENMYLVGDWVGDEGMLADAAFASARRAAELITSGARGVTRDAA